MLLLPALVMVGPAAGGETRNPLISYRAFAPDGSPWRPEAARDEIRPFCAVDPQVSHGAADGSLRIQCRDHVEYGGWTLTVDGIQPGGWYRFDAHYLPRQVTEERRTVVARLDWRQQDGERAGQPDYVYQTEDAGGGWRHIWALVPAPEGAAAVKVELLFGWSPGGTVWWDDISLAAADPAGPRQVKVATIHHRPSGNASAQANIEEFGKWVDRAAQDHPDIICLPEGMTMVGTGLTYAQVAEPIPGPTSRRLDELARKHNCYLVACHNERDGKGVYNTAILLGRKGELVGRYRKLYVPREEIEGGVTPGADCPVFETDFGKVAMMICWDAQYVDPAQRMALKGAEIILMPIWGGHETLMKARAIENQVFLVSSGYDVGSWVIDPEGKIVSEARKQGDGDSYIAVAEIDLGRRYLSPWLGDMRARFSKEHREDLR